MKPGPKPRYQNRFDTNVRMEKRDYLTIKKAVARLRRDHRRKLSVNEFISQAALSHARILLDLGPARRPPQPVR